MARRRPGEEGQGLPGRLRLTRQELEGWLENLLHHKFAGRRARGEWFLLSNQDVARLRRVAVWDRGFPPLAAVTIVDDPWYSEA